MNYIIIIGSVLLIAYLLYSRRGKNPSIKNEAQIDDSEPDIQEDETTEIPTFYDEKGVYQLVDKIKKNKRRTYLLGTLQGKYWGVLDLEKEKEYDYAKFFNFEIYEILVEISPSTSCNCINPNKSTCSGFHTETDGPFNLTDEKIFPRERLPEFIPVTLKQEGKEYSVNIHDPIITNVKFISKLHQTEGNEVYGTLEAIITGYLIDIVEEPFTEKKYITLFGKAPLSVQVEEARSYKTTVPTGKKEFKNRYQRIEYFYSDYEQTYWGDWKYHRSSTTGMGEGCLSWVFQAFGVILFLIFLIAMLPNLIAILPLILFFGLISIIPINVWRWLLNILGMLLIISSIYFLISGNNKSSRTYIPKKSVQKSSAVRIPQYIPIQDKTIPELIVDTLITHNAQWEDYDGIKYEGSFWVKKSDYQNSGAFKRYHPVSNSNFNNYNYIINDLYQFDKSKMGGVIQLFDSIRLENNLSPMHFAEVIVSFVQAIPYTLILPNACNADLYNDLFIKEYLNDPDNRCLGDEKYGLLTPVEFLASLMGDCDTRTLLLYTILSHYNFDVAILTSQYYNHSIIGINLPYEGITYSDSNLRYVLWETTSGILEPGLISHEISNLAYWKISIKSY